jgi:hypothetical protein
MAVPPADELERTWEEGLAAMAADPEVQGELHRIEVEFSVTEMDGLEKPDIGSA